MSNPPTIHAPDEPLPIPSAAAQNIADHYRYDAVIVIKQVNVYRNTTMERFS